MNILVVIPSTLVDNYHSEFADVVLGDCDLLH